MLVAGGSDAQEGDEPCFAAARPRLAEPETRSRVAGYLGAGAPAGVGWRTDGVWVWPDAVASHVRAAGVGPPRELVEHIAARLYLLPAEVPDEALADAARAAALTGPTGPTGPTEVDDRVAAAVADRLCARWHERLLTGARESLAPSAGPRVARLFDGQGPEGAPWFSPSRLRILEPERRRRLSAYLSGGRLVLRVTGRMPDQLDPGKGRVVPLNYRTDGVWVWPEALAYYLGQRGVAPELELLCHVEELGMRLPQTLPDGVVVAAAAMARRGPGPRLGSAPNTYHLDPAGRMLLRAVGDDPGRWQVLRDDLRWRPLESPMCDADLQDADLHEIDEAAAIRFIDARWAVLGAPPG